MEVVIEKWRYVGIDLGKREYTMAIISVKGKITLHEGKTSLHGRQGLYRLLEKTDKVARTKVRLRRGIWRSSWPMRYKSWWAARCGY